MSTKRHSFQTVLLFPQNVLHTKGCYTSTDHNLNILDTWLNFIMWPDNGLEFRCLLETSTICNKPSRKFFSFKLLLILQVSFFFNHLSECFICTSQLLWTLVKFSIFDKKYHGQEWYENHVMSVTFHYKSFCYCKTRWITKIKFCILCLCQCLMKMT